MTSLNKIDIKGYLIPFKYRINPELSSQHISFNPKQKKNSKRNNRIKLGRIYKHRLSSSLDKRKGKLQDIIRDEWNSFKQCINDSFDNFIEIHFNYILKRDIISDFGEKLAGVIEEILRDYKVTDKEKKYILEKAKEKGVPEKKAEALFNKYLSSKYETAFSKIIFEICRDGKITEAEKEYLFEKSQNYNVSYDRIVYKLNRTVEILNKVHEKFTYNEFYYRVHAFYLVNFISPNENSINDHFIKSLNNYIDKGKYLQSKNDINNILKYCIDKINIVLSHQVYDYEDANLEKLIKNLGVDTCHYNTKFYKEENRCTKFKTYKLKSDIEEVLNFLKNKMQKRSSSKTDTVEPKNQENRFKIGQRTYKITTSGSCSDSLFNYRIRGVEVTIFVNQKHYFYNDTLYFKKFIVSIVHNLINNHSYEKLVDEVKMLTNPPASIKINYPKE